MILPVSPLLIVASVTGCFCIIILVWMFRIQSRMKKLLAGKNAHSLEDSITSIMNQLKDLNQFTEEMEAYLTTVETRLKKSIQGVETIRFNPFKGTGSGGNNSFSTSFINEKGDGVVLTSMYSRDRISMFAKPVKGFASEYELSEEEAESVQKSKETLELNK